MQTAHRTILLTGATRGLGRALVGEFAERGHTIWGCGRSASHIEELRRAFPPPHDWSVVDVANADAVDAWAKRLLATGLVPDLLLNNAALINPPLPAWEVSREDFDALVDVNLKGVGNVIRAFVPSMVARKRGIIVNFSSGWGRSVSPDVAPYCMSKWAMEGLSQAMAEEIPSGMAVVPLNPGVIDTDMLRTCWGDAAGHYTGPERWARAAGPFLLGLGPKDNGRSLTVPGVAVD